MLHIILDLLIPELSPNQPLESKQRIRRVDNSLSLGGRTNKTFSDTVVGEGDE